MSEDLVVVTGTSSGLGAAIADALVAADYQVLGISRRAVPAREGYAHRTYDLADLDGIHDLATGIVAEHGVPYALINCAAVGTDGVLPTLHNSDIERTITLNLTSPILLTKYLSRGMLDRRRGRIINITSIVASTGFRGLSVYGAAKAGLEGFTRSLARDLGRRQITVNAIAPGFMHTEMTARVADDQLSSITRRSPLGRLAGPSAVTAAVLMLLGPAGDDITGSVVTVDAGSTA